jgi:adenosine deaminase
MDLRAYPKVELHRHLEGAIRLSTLVELSKKMGTEIPSEPMRQKEFFLVQEPMKDLAEVLNKFWATQAILNSEEILARITFEAIEDAYKDGIRILELRYAPTFIRQNHENLSFEQIHRSILKGVKFAEKLPIAVGLICIFQRTLPLKTSQAVLDFAIESKSTWIGVDLADDEVAVPAKNFTSLFEQAKKAGFRITVHAGESNVPQAAENVRDSIQLLGAERIGHGLQISKNAAVLSFVKEKKTPLELCPTSNWLTNAVSSLETHPIRQLIQQGILVTINSDDPGVFGIDLTNEYELLHGKYGFTETDFNHCNDIAAKASFIPIATKQKYWPREIY